MEDMFLFMVMICVGERNYLIIISPEEAAKEIIDSEHFELFEDRFSELKELAKEIYDLWELNDILIKE